MAKLSRRHVLGAATDHVLELSFVDRHRLFNLGYYTWVEQQGKTYPEIQAQWYDPCYWTDVQKQAGQIDELITEFNERVGLIQQYR